jgi:hypothetical protein
LPLPYGTTVAAADIGTLVANELETAKTEVVLRLVAQRNGIELSRKEQFDACEIVTLLQVLLLEKKVGK